MKNKKIKFKHWECALKLGSYSNNRTALCLVDADDGSVVAVATVNIVAVSDDEFAKIADTIACEKEQLLFIKDWSENEGMFNSLVDQGIVRDAEISIPTGFVHANVGILNRITEQTACKK